MVITSSDVLGREGSWKNSLHIEDSYWVINLTPESVILLKNPPNDSQPLQEDGDVKGEQT